MTTAQPGQKNCLNGTELKILILRYFKGVSDNLIMASMGLDEVSYRESIANALRKFKGGCITDFKELIEMRGLN